MGSAETGGRTIENVVAVLLLLLPMTGCGSTESLRPPDRADLELEPKVAGLEGKSLGLEFRIDDADTPTRRAIEAWFGEAIGQTSWLDVRPGRDGDRLVVRGQLASGATSTLTTSFVSVRGAPVPLAGVRGFDRAGLPAAIDRLAAETRVTLGEPKGRVRAERRAAEAIVSRSAEVAAACARAETLVRERRLADAAATLERALRRDPSCALALSLAAGVWMDQGRPSRAVELARRVASLPGRASPAAMHRAERVLLLATSRDYRALVALADRAATERPNDSQVRFTRALGLCLLSRYSEALPSLQRLLAQLPDSPGVSFCLGHALLATGRLDEARALMPRIAERVPALPAGRLEAWILLAQGEHEKLDAHLDQLARRDVMRLPAGQLVVLSMRAAHAILRGRDERAGNVILEQMDRMRASPELLVARAGLLTDQAWVLARLGRAADCDKMLASLRGNEGLPMAVRPASMVAQALVDLALRRPLPDERLRHLEVAGQTGWRHRIGARLALQSGDPDRALRLLREAATRTSDLTLLLEYAEALRESGDVARADALLARIVEDLDTPSMAEPALHPLVRPKLALVSRAARKK